MKREKSQDAIRDESVTASQNASPGQDTTADQSATAFRSTTKVRRQIRVPNIGNAQARSVPFMDLQMPSFSGQNTAGQGIVPFSMRRSRQEDLTSNWASLQLLGIPPSERASVNQNATATSRSTLAPPSNMLLPSLSGQDERVRLPRRPSAQVSSGTNWASLQLLGVLPSQSTSTSQSATSNRRRIRIPRRLEEQNDLGSNPAFFRPIPQNETINPMARASQSATASQSRPGSEGSDRKPSPTPKNPAMKF